MCKFRCLACLIPLFGLGFGSQPDECLFKKQHLVISLDWHKKISRPNSIATNKHYFLSNEGFPDLIPNDTIQMQGLQTDASRVTFGKIALESLGAAAGGAFSGYACTKIAGDHVFWQGTAAFIGVAAGAAGGTTSVGNLLMEPNGSFTKSLIGSTAGTGLSAGVLVFIWYASWHTGSADWTEYYVVPCLGLAAVLPVAGAVIGYNLNISKKSVVPMMNSPEENEFLDGGSQRHYPLIKCQIITIKLPWVSK